MTSDSSLLPVLWDEQAGDKPFVQLFVDQVARTPDALAVEFEGRRVTYRQLNERANQLAHHLVGLGLGDEARVGICLDRSISAIECMIGILKAGCAFVPLDPEFPQDRLAYIAEHAGISLIFADGSYRDRFTEQERRGVDVVSPDETALTAETSAPNVGLSAHNLAYVMYTSGSTGKPKGVQIEHGNLTTYCLADARIYQLRSDDRTLQFSTLNFDIAIEEIFPPLLTGGAVIVRPRSRSAAAIELSDLIETHHITALHIATAYWHEWVDLMAASRVQVPTDLRLVIVTGEKVSVEHYRRWRRICGHDVLWCNAYGPTETTVTSTVFIPSADWDADPMPIGFPLPGYDAFILDEALNPVAAGETGQLFIGGGALARGYLDRPDLTEKAFLSVTLPGESDSRRLYRTGDLARWLDSGEIEFAGRVDHQMKIGSYRIEPGEIEAILNQHEAVQESLIVCEEDAGQKFLVAHVVIGQHGTLRPAELAEFLRSRLPAYMVPSRYSMLPSFPKTINGKIDRDRLPRGSELETCSSIDQESEPTTPWELTLAEVWRDVLRLPRVGIHDDFFQLGGSSLLVTRVITRLSDRLNVAIPVRDFFANPTIASLAIHLETLMAPADTNPRSDRRAISETMRARLPRIQTLPVMSLGARIANLHYPPVAGSQATRAARRHGVLIAPSHGHEYTRAHRNLQQLAVQLAQAGFDVVRLDYAGTGDSDGGEERINVEQWKSDLRQTAQAMRSSLELEKLSVLGVRLGANLLAEANLPGLAGFLAWDPIWDGGEFLDNVRAMHRSELADLTRYLNRRDSASDELLGYDWPIAFQQQVSKLDWEPSPRVGRGDLAERCCCLLTSGEARPVLHSLAAGATPERAWDYQHVPDEVFWDRLEFTNAAFASPATSLAAVTFLTSDD